MDNAARKRGTTNQCASNAADSGARGEASGGGRLRGSQDPLINHALPARGGCSSMPGVSRRRTRRQGYGSVGFTELENNGWGIGRVGLGTDRPTDRTNRASRANRANPTNRNSPMVLDVVVAAPGESLGDLGPLVVVDAMLSYQYRLLRVCRRRPSRSRVSRKKHHRRGFAASTGSEVPASSSLDLEARAAFAGAALRSRGYPPLQPRPVDETTVSPCGGTARQKAAPRRLPQKINTKPNALGLGCRCAHLLRRPRPLLEVRIQVVQVALPYLLAHARLPAGFHLELRGDHAPLVPALLDQLRRSARPRRGVRPTQRTSAGRRARRGCGREDPVSNREGL